jgi:hypothetical protein
MGPLLFRLRSAMPAETAYPNSRTAGLVVQEVQDEVLVYDLDTRKACCLNGSAALVWRFCDGANSISEIAEQLSSSLNSRVSTGFVALALEQLNKHNLIEDNGAISGDSSLASRRDVLKIAGSAVALPVILTLIAPATTAQSFSNCHCVSPAECQHTNCPSTTFCNNLAICAPLPPTPRSART